MVMIGALIKAKDPAEAWLRGLGFIMENGLDLTDERGTSTKEVLHLQTVIEKPFNGRAIPIEFGWDKEHLDRYADQLMSFELGGFAYTYGNRMRAWGHDLFPNEIDQLEMVVKRLKESRITRRASISTWIPTLDHYNSEVPCMMVADFKYRDDKLHLGIYFRSHDFCSAYPANVYGMSEVLRHVAAEIGLEPGSIVTNSASAHIYERDFEWVRNMLDAK